MGLIFQLINPNVFIRLKQGQITIEYRWNHQSYDLSTKDLYLVDNQWHQVQIKRKQGQITLMIDEYHLQFEYDTKIDQIFEFTQLYLGGNDESNAMNFHGCLKEVSFTFNENTTLEISQDLLTNRPSRLHEYGTIHQLRCSSLFNPIEFLISSSYLSLDLPEHIQQMNSYQWNISFHFQTYSSEAILFYANNKLTEDFLGLDLIDGFFYLTVNRGDSYHRQELFQQRLNDGQTHFFHLYIQGYQGGLELQITLDRRENIRVPIRNAPSKIHVSSLDILLPGRTEMKEKFCSVRWTRRRGNFSDNIHFRRSLICRSQ